MDPPVAAEVETKSEKTDEGGGSSRSYDCGLCDTEVVYKIAQELLPGLASSCVDNTTGGIFKNAGTVAVDMRKEMADYLTKRSETFVAEFLLAENASGLEVSEHPYDILLILIDDFTASKRNMFSRVSELVLSDRREDRIDDFVQELEINGFWLLARRECIATTLLKNVDYKNQFHCNIVCKSEEEVAAHRLECKFRPMDCTSEGCTTRYCAAQKENHEAVCPFMILPCEQKCSDFVMRREMDRHCVTICPMKLVNCAFYTVGCESSIPRCNVQQHNASNLSSHLLYIVRTAHKEATDEDLKHRVEQILNLSNADKLARARDARALTYLIKDAEAKLGPLELKTNPQAAESPKSPNKGESPIKTEPSSTEQPSAVKDGSDSPNKKEEQQVSQPADQIKSTNEKADVTKDNVPSTREELSDSAPIVELATPNNNSEIPVKSKDNEDSYSSTLKDGSDSPMKKDEEHEVEQTTRSLRGENVKDESSNTMGEESMKATKNETVKDQSNGDDEKESKKSPMEEKSKQLSTSDEDDTKKSPKKEATEKPSRRDGEESSPQRVKTQPPPESNDEESTKMKSPM